MVGQSDRQDRREATHLFLAVVVAVIVLICVGGGAVYLLSDGLAGWSSEVFAPGLGLKDAAIAAFVIAFVSIVILTVVSGGDAIIGELPFTLIGFFLFFIFCWLMLAWIF